MSSWMDGSPLITYEEGTLSEFSEYRSMLPSSLDYCGGRVDVIVDGRSRVDAALSVLPLLLKHGGYIYVHDWPVGEGGNHIRQCYPTLLQWFTIVDEVDTLRVLKPRQEIVSVLKKGVYDWCFAWHSGTKLIEIVEGPMGGGAVEELLGGEELNCVEEGDRVCCEPLLDKTFFLEVGCIPCKVILESAAGRGGFAD